MGILNPKPLSFGKCYNTKGTPFQSPSPKLPQQPNPTQASCHGCSVIHDRKLSSTSLTAFLTRVITTLPPTSDLSTTLQHFADEVEALVADATEAQQRDYTLTSEFEIDERPGARATGTSAKLRREADRAMLTGEDEEYTRLVVVINEYLKQVVEYVPPFRPDVGRESLLFKFMRALCLGVWS